MATVTLDAGFTKTLTIASGQTVSSDVLDLTHRARRGTWSMMIYGPATLPEAVRIQVAPSAESSVWYDVQSSGADTTIAAGKALPLTEIVSGAMRLVAGSAVAAARAFIIQAKPEA